MAKTSAPDLPDRTKGRIVLLAFFLLLLYVVLPRLRSFSSSITAVQDAHVGYLGLAALFVVATYLLAATTYMLLAIKRLSYGQTLLVQTASAFANRLLPAGLGGLALNVRYLQKERHSLPQALAVASANNTLGFVGHALLFVFAVIVSRGELFEHLHGPHINSETIAAAVIVIVGLNLLISHRWRQHLLNVAGQALSHLAAYRKRPARLMAALTTSLLLTCCHVAILGLCALAVGVHLPLWDLFVVFTLGIAVATATPTPGGLGGAEAGLAAGLVAYGFDASMALAVALLYRLLTYWLPLVPGFITFLAIRKRYI